MVESLEQITSMMRLHGANRIFAKVLAPNDNSKNQIYLGGDFSALNIIPHGDILIDDQVRAGSIRPRPKAPVAFTWIDENGRHPAPNANLILYPDYPEVRLSGILRGCQAAPSQLINQRLEGRVMFFGVAGDGQVLGHVVANGHPAGNEVKSGKFDQLGVFLELEQTKASSPRFILLQQLKRIHEIGWIRSQKLSKDGLKRPYSARNGGGYTLEAELGITPNGYSEPDFLGWEVKQFGVRDFERYSPKSPVTLMTPEPTGGLYKVAGLEAFLNRYGYPDKAGRVGRTNFGGVYRCGGDFHNLTGLRMVIDGFDPSGPGKISNLEAGISLLDKNGEIAATWSFKGLMDHWNRKHAQSVYVPSLCRTPPLEYRFASKIQLCEGTDFIEFLRAFVAGSVFYDPAIKMVSNSSSSTSKRRSQFRINHRELPILYHQTEGIDLAVSF